MIAAEGPRADDRNPERRGCGRSGHALSSTARRQRE
jgi:hypothetical protein